MHEIRFVVWVSWLWSVGCWEDDVQIQGVSNNGLLKRENHHTMPLHQPTCLLLPVVPAALYCVAWLEYHNCQSVFDGKWWAQPPMPYWSWQIRQAKWTEGIFSTYWVESRGVERVDSTHVQQGITSYRGQHGISLSNLRVASQRFPYILSTQFHLVQGL